MSGIEVAGLILGAFPLLISALEKNEEAKQAFRDWWKIRKPYESCLGFVQTEHDIFRMNIRKLLEPLLPDTARLDELFADPYGKEWSSESLAEKFQNLLPTTFSVFIFVMREFHETMIALGRELGMNNQAFQRAMNVSLDLDNAVARLLTRHSRQAPRAQARKKSIYEGLRSMKCSESDSV